MLIPQATLDKAFVIKFKQQGGYQICTWTVDDLQEGRRALDLRVLFPISNSPALLLSLIP
ncbi:MAG: hypothetical protein WBI82_13645 [Sphaerochaeta sp.]